MNTTYLAKKLLAALAFAALAAFALPQPAFADDELPPVPTEPVATDESAVDTTVQEESAPIPDATEVPDDVLISTAEAPVEESTVPVTAEAPTIAEDPGLIPDLPENTELIVVDENGAPVALASVEAADALATGDPIWCPASVATPVNGGSGCSPSQTSFAALITWLENNPKSVAGTIWIEKTFDSGSADLLSTVFTLDGGPTGNLPSLANFALTIKGGWNGLGSNTINTADPSEFNGALQILNWNADITLSDILFTGIPTGDALYIDTSKKITLTRVDVIDNAGNGAVLDNTDSGTGTGAVAITSSTFSGNTGDGLTIDTRGSITMSYISANGNDGYGAILTNNTAGSDLAVTLSGINEFKFNGGGLQVNSRGAVTLKNVYANYNNLYEGATIDNFASTTGAVVTLTGTNQFNQNGSHGLEIISKGGITINKLSANGNGLAVGAITSFGAHLDNSGASLPKGVSLTTANNFSDNFDYGLLVESKGAITITLLTADRNGGNGAEINNLASLSTSPQNVTFTGASGFTQNDGTGLTIDTFGTVLLGGVTANDNNVAGAVINNSTGTIAKAVTSNGNNNFINNATQGLQIDSRGAITLNNVFADENGSFGAWLNNSTVSTAAAVMVKGISEFNSNGGYGLNIQSKGNITVNNFDADWNGGYGLQFVNNVAGSVGNVTVITTLTGWCNSAFENNGRGMLITSYGNVSLSHLCSEGNLGEGVRIENNNANSSKSVILSGNNSSSDNDETGLVILSKGPVTINNLYLSGNGWIDDTGAMDGLGAYINNRLGGTSSFQNVTFTGRVSAFDNFYSGLEVYSYGAISLINVTADNNGYGEEDDLNKRGYGVYLDNQTLLPTSPKAISLKGTNTITGNWDGGLWILGSGAISLTNIDVSNNNGFGAWVTNDDYNTDSFRGSLSVSGFGSFDSNGAVGLGAIMYGSITAANLDAYTNGDTGVFLQALRGNILLTGSNDFHSNDGTGLSAYASGNISASNLYASGNHEDGASLTNANVDDGGTGTITLKGILRFGYNWGDGLSARSNKALSFVNLEAYGNGGNGATLYSRTSISLSGSSSVYRSNTFDGNGQVGLYIVAPASVTLTNITAINNGSEGVFINNTSGPTTGTKGITLNGTNIFNGNGWDGLSVQSYGAIKANNITANGNDGSGAYLDNLWDENWEHQAGITLTGTNIFNNNTGPYAGLDMYSHGNITVNNASANDNSGGGAVAWNWSYGWYLGLPPVGVKFTGINTFNNNTYDDTIPNTYGAGLYVYTEGAITLSNVTANGNEQKGVYLNNGDPNWSWTNPSIAINGINEFSDNGQNGIYIFSVGNVSLTRVTAEWNTQSGVSIDTTGKVTLTCASLNFNEDRGWQIRGLNGITLIAVLTYGNTDGDGLNLGGSLTMVRSCTLQ